MIDVIAFAITAKIYPNNIALTTSIIETSLNLAVALSPFLGGVFYEVRRHAIKLNPRSQLLLQSNQQTMKYKLFVLQVGGFYLSFVVTAAAVTAVLVGSIFGVTDVDTKRDDKGGNLMT